MNDLISVIMPVYMVETYLSQSIESVLSQEIPVATREQSGVLCFHSRWMPVSPGASGMQPRDPLSPWLQSTDLIVVAHGLSSMGDLPGSGIKPMSPALAGGFFIAEPPRKLQLFFLFVLTCNFEIIQDSQETVKVVQRGPGCSPPNFSH